MIEKAIFFAAGKGTRMSPLTNFTPKPLIKVFNTPIIEKNIELLISNGIKEITIVVGYLKEQFLYLKDKYKNIKINLVDNALYNETNNISSLYFSKNFISNTLYIEGDIFLTNDIFPKIINSIKENNFKSTMFGALSEKEIKEWVFKIVDGKVMYHYLSENAKNDYKWTGFMFIDEIMTKEIVEKIDVFFNIEENKQLYFEQFLWTLNNKFLFSNSIKENDFYELDNFEDLIKIDSTYQNHTNTILFTPGPTNIIDEIKDIITDGIVHHRSKLMEYYTEKLTENLKKVFNTKSGFPLIITTSGTGIMEATVQNLISANDKILLINTGDFAERFKELLNIYDAQIDELKYDRWSSFDIKDIEKKLLENNFKYKALFVTHHETSTGIMQDLEAISKLIKNKDILFIADTVSSVVHENLDFDDLGLDVAFASTAKAFGLPPGLSAVCLSPKAIDVTYKNQNKRYYFDFRKYIEYYNNLHQSPFTPASNLIIAWNASIELLLNKGFKNIRERKRELSNYIREELVKLGFENIENFSLLSGSMVILKTPKNINAFDMKNEIAVKNNIYFETGRNEDKSKILRIGISESIDKHKCDLLIEAIKNYLKNK